LCALVPVIEDVATSILFDGSPITLRFTPSGNAHLLVRVATVVTATANGASADVEIGGSAPSSLFNDPLTGTLDVSLDSLTYSIDVESTDPCFEVLR
jgi:hypothetical protein